MDVMEKIVDLLREAPYNIFGNKLGNCYFDSCLELIADHLIAHGVTVQEWIPVTERIPEKNDRWVLCLCVSGAIEVLKFDYTMWNWDAQYPGRCYMENYVTNWMPLPEPPKGVHDEAKES